MLFWKLLYLHYLDIRCCRCSFGNQCICKALIFIVVDALLVADVSATCFSLNLQMLFTLPVMYNCICILPFLYLADTPSRNFASSICSFYTLQILPAEILHPHFQKIHYRRYRCPIFFEPYLLHGLSRYVPYKKIDIRNSSEYGMSVGDI